MSNENNALEVRLTDYFRRITDTPLPVANAVRLAYEKHNLTASDIRVVVMKGTQSSLLSLVEENRELRAEINRLKEARGLKWSEFVAVAATKVDVKQKRWRQVLASRFGYTMNTFAEWEHEDRVPYMMLKKIDDLPDLRGESKSPPQNMARIVSALVRALSAGGVKPSHISLWLLGLYESSDRETVSKLIEEALLTAPVASTERAAAYKWSTEEYQLAVHMLIDERLPGPQVAAHFGLTEGPIWSRFKNREPDESLLGRDIEVKREGSMDALELWKLGHNLYGVGWREKIQRQFKLGGRKILFNPPEQVLTPEQIQTLRDEWHVQQQRKAASKARKATQDRPSTQ